MLFERVLQFDAEYLLRTHHNDTLRSDLDIGDIKLLRYAYRDSKHFIARSICPASADLFRCLIEGFTS